MYRLSSALVPYGTHPDLPEFHGQIEDCAAQLADLGSYANGLGVRLSSHPGQYVVLNPASERVSVAAARDLELQARLFDAMGLGPDAVIVLHVGSAEGGHEAGKIRFLRAVERLSERARARLVIENDDRVFALKHVLEISERTGLRVVWDVLHHHCNDPGGLSDREALRLALATWPGEQTPKIHYSSPRTSIEQRVAKRGRQHGAEPRASAAPCARGHGRPRRLRMVPTLAGTRPELRHHARGEGKGRSAAAPTRAALGARHPDARPCPPGTLSASAAWSWPARCLARRPASSARGAIGHWLSLAVCARAGLSDSSFDTGDGVQGDPSLGFEGQRDPRPDRRRSDSGAVSVP
jgi:hypothetical protein